MKFKHTRIMAALLLPLAAQAAPQETPPAAQVQTITGQGPAGAAGAAETQGSITAGGLSATLATDKPAPGTMVIEGGKLMPVQGVLMIGSPAPAVKFGEFHKGEAFQKLDPDKTYIIEFWAIRCAPCVAAMPHLTELAKTAGDSVVAVGVNAWNDPAESIKDFLGRQGDKVGYRIASDSEGFMMQSWMKAAGANGIPYAFVVVKGKVMWAGHAAELDHATLADLQSGKLTVEVMRKRHDGNLACAREIGIPIMATKGDADVVLAKIKELATKYPEATKPAHMRAHYEKMKTNLPDGEPTQRSVKQQMDFSGGEHRATVQIDTSTPAGQELMKVILNETKVNQGSSREAVLKWQDGRKMLRVIEDSKLLFDGPVDTEEEQAKIPAEVKEQFARMWILGKIAKQPGEQRTPAEAEEYMKAEEAYNNAPR